MTKRLLDLLAGNGEAIIKVISWHITKINTNKMRIQFIISSQIRKAGSNYQFVCWIVNGHYCDTRWNGLMEGNVNINENKENEYCKY